MINVKKKRRAKSTAKRFLGFLPSVYINVILFLTFIPLIVILVYSFNDSRLYFRWDGFSLKWYGEILRDKSIFRYLTNSLVLAGISSVLAGIIGTLGAFGLHKTKLPTNKVLEYIATLPIMVPEIVLAICLYGFFAFVNIPRGFISLVIGHTSFCIPYVLLLVKSRLVGISDSYVEAARDLGATEKKAFLSVTVPLVWPATLSGMLLAFVMSLDDVIISTRLSTSAFSTLPEYVYSNKAGLSPAYYALCSLMLLVSVVFILLSKFFGNLKKGSSEEETV